MIIRADARQIPLADGSVQCVVTSPPYWGLRDYAVAGQIGLEATPEEWVATMVQVFREVKRVLRDDGTLWLNLGDSYASSSATGHGGWDGNNKNSDGTPRQNRQSGDKWLATPTAVSGLKPKDLCGMPWRVAFALQTDGWYLRSDIIWAKPNPMPESVTDRPTRSHEYLFLLAKSERYFYDADAIREPNLVGTHSRGGVKVDGTGNSMAARVGGYNGLPPTENPAGRNKRDVWTVNSEPCPDAHFATFPSKLIEPCILAGTSEKGCCAECGAPRVRQIDVEYVRHRASINRTAPREHSSYVASRGEVLNKQVTTTGWQPSCAHDAPSVPCVVFDPFIGSGTVGKVCEALGRRWAGLELSADYIGIARKRTAQMGLFTGWEGDGDVR